MRLLTEHPLTLTGASCLLLAGAALALVLCLLIWSRR